MPASLVFALTKTLRRFLSASSVTTERRKHHGYQAHPNVIPNIVPTRMGALMLCRRDPRAALPHAGQLAQLLLHTAEVAALF